MTIVSIAVVKILFLFAFAFVVTVLWTPLLTHFLYRYKLGKSIRNTGSSPIFSKMHAHKAGTPTMGGVLVWGTMILMVLFFGVGSKLFPSVIPPDFSFFNSAQTLLPLGALVASAIVGLIDDIFDVKNQLTQFGNHHFHGLQACFTGIVIKAGFGL